MFNPPLLPPPPGELSPLSALFLRSIIERIYEILFSLVDTSQIQSLSDTVNMANMGPLTRILLPMPLTSSEWAKRPVGETFSEWAKRQRGETSGYPLAAAFNTYLAVFSRCL